VTHDDPRAAAIRAECEKEFEAARRAGTVAELLKKYREEYVAAVKARMDAEARVRAR
jgi:hypothetical protein